jgi:hypothetical protein
MWVSFLVPAAGITLARVFAVLSVVVIAGIARRVLIAIAVAVVASA